MNLKHALGDRVKFVKICKSSIKFRRMSMTLLNKTAQESKATVIVTYNKWNFKPLNKKEME